MNNLISYFREFKSLPHSTYKSIFYSVHQVSLYKELIPLRLVRNRLRNRQKMQ